MILSSAIEDHSSGELQRSSSSGEMPVTPHIRPGKKRRRGSEVDDVILENLRQLQERDKSAATTKSGRRRSFCMSNCCCTSPLANSETITGKN